MRIGIFAVVVWLVCSPPASGQEVPRRWPAPQRLALEGSANDPATYAGDRALHLSEPDRAGGTLWLRGALVGGGIGAVLGGVAALLPAAFMIDGSTPYLSEYTFSWGGIGLLIGGVLGAAIGNEYHRRSSMAGEQR